MTLALEAGNDIIISSSTAGLNSALWTDNINRMQTVPEFRARIKDAAYRVILAKLNYFKGGNAAPLYPDSDTIYESIPDKEGQAFFMDQACRSITLYKKGSAYPLKPTDEDRVLIAGPFLSLYEEGRKRFPNADTFHYSWGRIACIYKKNGKAAVRIFDSDMNHLEMDLSETGLFLQGLSAQDDSTLLFSWARMDTLPRLGRLVLTDDGNAVLELGDSDISGGVYYPKFHDKISCLRN